MTHIFKEGEAGNLLYCWFPAMHTRVDIAIVSPLDEASLLSIVAEVKKRICEIENIGNCFNQHSELSQYNSNGKEHFALSSELQRILHLCDYWKKETAGLFDVSVEGKINLSGFLKGYALDEIRPILEANNIENALVSMGNSSVLALGSQPGSTGGWIVKNAQGETFTLRNQCLTTSGNDSPERRHIINPLTGQYKTGQGMVSVITSGGAEGEVRATEKFLLKQPTP